MAASASGSKPLEEVTLVMDNGADLIKIGVVPKEKNGQPGWSSTCLTVPNFIAKTRSGKKRFISNQVAKCHDTSGLHISRAFDRGYMCLFDLQKTIWDHIFGPEALNVDPTQTDLLLTEPINNFEYSRNVILEMLFEDFGFRAIMLSNAAQLAENNHTQSRVNSPTDKENTNPGNRSRVSAGCTLVVESGFSFTHVIPFIDGHMAKSAIRRINVGGKVLTNQLKEIISYRQFHVMEETYLVNQVKEDMCYVSRDFNADMDNARLKWPDNKVYREYVLPDFTAHHRGYLRSAEELTKRPGADEQILKLNNERFSVPELLFNPSDVGLKQMGIGDVIHEVVRSFPYQVQPHLYENILLTGGCAKFPGFRDRVYDEVRKEAPGDFNVQVTLVDDPITYACHGGNKLAYKGQVEKGMFTRQEWLEHGRSATHH